MMCPYMLSTDKIELQFATNHVGHFLLTHLLLDTMKSTARESNQEGRIIIVSSEGHRLSYKEGIRFDKINNEAEYNNVRAYGQAKLANILHANELARLLKEEGINITANSLHPGVIATNLYRHTGVIASWYSMDLVLAFFNLIKHYGHGFIIRVRTLLTSSIFLFAQPLQMPSVDLC
ncbi:unnamed protein product [Linum tenue]|uniref:Short-chain dehydrogenase TIC 32, chloroplastic n=1 Tax=Linum tenue TaxID=586396 RepID=A0AAV0Q1E5_9ROSI|nr:unnamed protein product [Linum tenue]